MVSFKLDKYDRIFIAFVCVLIVLFNIGSLVFASEGTEEVDLTIINNLSIASSRNYFAELSGTNLAYFQLEKGYVYYFENTSPNAYNRNYAVSSELPAVNGTYELIASTSESFSYIANNDDYIYFSFSPNTYVSVTRSKIASMDGAVGGLTESVGFNQFWGVFEGGIDFVGVVVLVAFGVFLLALAIKKISKGKSEF